MLQSRSDDGGGEEGGEGAGEGLYTSFSEYTPACTGAAGTGRFNQTQAQPVQRDAEGCARRCGWSARGAAIETGAAAAAAVVGTISLARQLKNTRRGRSVKPCPHDRSARRKEDSTDSSAHERALLLRCSLRRLRM